jgi:hypothetical protein
MQPTTENHKIYGVVYQITARMFGICSAEQDHGSAVDAHGESGGNDVEVREERDHTQQEQPQQEPASCAKATHQTAFANTSKT